ncbi:hypothetical protein [Nostocoides sp. HKS02]|uniref:hypothetical protein n=1 Tax=Nostocoides sp. HKS02 TaxID=1813880 RepID=UPI0012B4701A|nr:hypothetical protein [Tetrasphaera sp. HKS02]QGN58607.1 hypothetical protein GKE56_12760 [Tetrasphaera sp. HKS02]
MERTHGVETWCAFGRDRRVRRPICSVPPQSAVRASAAHDQTLLVYVLDVYDPWAYAYLPSVCELFQAAAPTVGVEVVNSGRYDGRDISELAASTAAVAASTGAAFGSEFYRLLGMGGVRLDAEHAAAGMIGLLAAGDLPVATVLAEVHREFFIHGRPLDAPGVLRSVGDRLGLDGHAIEVFADTERARELAAEDFAMAVDFDSIGGPVLLASHAGRVFEFDGLGASGARLVDQFRSVLARP